MIGATFNVLLFIFDLRLINFRGPALNGTDARNEQVCPSLWS